MYDRLAASGRELSSATTLFKTVVVTIFKLFPKCVSFIFFLTGPHPSKNQCFFIASSPIHLTLYSNHLSLLSIMSGAIVSRSPDTSMRPVATLWAGPGQAANSTSSVEVSVIYSKLSRTIWS